MNINNPSSLPMSSILNPQNDFGDALQAQNMVFGRPVVNIRPVLTSTAPSFAAIDFPRLPTSYSSSALVNFGRGAYDTTWVPKPPPPPPR